MSEDVCVCVCVCVVCVCVCVCVFVCVVLCVVDEVTPIYTQVSSLGFMHTRSAAVQYW